MHHKLHLFYYCLQTKFWEGNVFTPVCNSVYGGGGAGRYLPLGRGCLSLDPGGVCLWIRGRGAVCLWIQEGCLSLDPMGVGGVDF